MKRKYLRLSTVAVVFMGVAVLVAATGSAVPERMFMHYSLLMKHLNIKNGCKMCHVFEPHTSEKAATYSVPTSPGVRPAVLLTHRTFFEKGVYEPAVCEKCHKDKSALGAAYGRTHIISLMFTHIEDNAVKCMDCHDEIVSHGLKAAGGSIDGKKCVGCHEEKRVDTSCAFCHRRLNA